MDSTKERPVTSGAPIKQVGETTARVAASSDTRPWYDQVDWMTSPGYAYLKGLQDGVLLGLEQYDRELAAAICRALGADTRAEAIGGLIRYRDQVAARGGRGWVG